MLLFGHRERSEAEMQKIGTAGWHAASLVLCQDILAFISSQDIFMLQNSFAILSVSLVVNVAGLYYKAINICN